MEQIESPKRRLTETALLQVTERERFLADVIEKAEMPFGVGAPDGSLLMFNQAFVDLTGYSREELIQKQLTWATDLTPPEWREYEAKYLAEALSTRQPVRYEKEYLRKDGTRVPIELFVHPVFDNAGNILHYSSFLTDITERKQAEEKLRISEEKFACAFADNPAAIALTRLEDGLFLDVNDTWVALTGYSRDEAIGNFARTMRIWPAPDAAARFVQALWEKGSLYGWEQEFYNKSGEIFTAQLSAQILTINGEKVILSTLVDITDRKKAEEALWESHAKLEAAIESMTDAVFISDEEGNFIDFNNAFATFHRFKSKEEFYREFPRYIDVFEGYFVDGTLAPVDMWPVQQALRGEIATDFELILRRKDTGETWIASYNFAPIRDKDGLIIGSVVVASDITERKRIEQERKTTMAFLELVNDSKGTADLVHSAVSFFRECSGFEAVGIRLKDGNDYPYLEASGFPEEFVRMENRLCVRDTYGQLYRDNNGYPIHECMCGNVICGRFDPSKPFFTSRGSFFTNCTTELLATMTDTDRQTRTRNRCNGEGYESVVLIALRVGEECLGLLQLNDRRKGQFSPETIVMWERLTDYLAVALAKMLAEESLSDVYEKLQVQSEEIQMQNEELQSQSEELHEAYEVLNESEKKYRMLFENMTEAFYLIEVIYDKDGKPYDYRFLEVNPTYELNMGIKKEQMLGKSLFEVYSDINPITIEKYDEIAISLQPVQFEIFSHVADDKYLDVYAFSPEKGKIAVIFKDITERKKVEEALKETRDNLEEKVKKRTAKLEETYNTLQKNQIRLNEAQKIAHFGDWDWDVVTGEVYWSKEIYCIFELDPLKFGVTYGSFLNYVHPNDRDYVNNAFKEALSGKSPDIEYQIILSNGEVRTVQVQSEVIFDEKRAPVRVRGTLQDITERKKAEEKIQTLANIVESSNDAIITASLDGIITSWNKGAQEVYGYLAEEVLRKNISILEPDMLKGETKQLADEIKKGKKVNHYETSRLKKDGTTINVSVYLSPIMDQSGKFVAVSCIAGDITEKKIAEKLLYEKEMAEVANSTKSEFMANMSHELRTPLNSIIGFSDMLHEQAYGNLNQKQLRAAGNISTSGRHLLSLINNILDISKVEAGKMELNYKNFELSSKLNMIRNLLSPIADRKNINIEINMESKLISICADEDKFVRIMYNLVDNAIKFSYEDSVVEIGMRKKGELVEISVNDTGIGIKTEDKHKLFKPFSQVDSFSYRKPQGTGLGLHIVKQIVHLHGGYVWFRSNLGVGSTFSFAIPINSKIMPKN